MVDKKVLLKELILNNPSLSANEIYNRTKGTPLGMRKTNVLKIIREVRNIPEPTKAKKEKSTPIKFRPSVKKPTIKKPTKPKVSKPKPSVKKPTKPKPTKQLKLPVVVEFKDTKFGKIVRDLQKGHGISEKKAIIHARKLLKIPRTDYDKINERDVQILLAHTP